MSLEIQNEIEENADERAENFQQNTTPFPLYTSILIGCIVLVAVVQFLVDSQDKTFSGNKSIVFAGFVKPLFVDGQYWRILTGGVLHAGIAHLFFNSYAAYVFGRPFETLTNRAHLIIVFLLSVVGGHILSLIFLPDGTSVGASGGIIGFLGYLTVYALKRRKLLNPEFLKNLLMNIGLITFFGLVVMRNVDNFGHLGGFLTGAVYALIQVPSDLYKDPRFAGRTTELIGKAAIGLLFLICLFSIFVLLGVIKISLPEF